MRNQKIAIIGAGISGLTIANQLSSANKVTIFDKSRGLGGRMATRRVEDYHFDHGTQFFTAKSEEFKNFCQNLYQKNIIDIWNARFCEINNDKITREWEFNNKDIPHYVAIPQMNNLCKYLANDLDVRLKEQIKRVEFKNQKWSLKTVENKIFFDFDYLILAIPAPQAVNLLPKNFKYLDIIKNIQMLPCFSLMIGFKEKLDLKFDAALVKESVISWISVNNSKKDRPDAFTLLVNSNNQWAEDNLESNLEQVKEKLINQLQKIIDFDQNKIDHINIHLWRYANAKLRDGKKSLFDKNLNLGICGDYFISGRVENGFLSALDLARSLNN